LRQTRQKYVLINQKLEIIRQAVFNLNASDQYVKQFRDSLSNPTSRKKQPYGVIFLTELPTLLMDAREIIGC